MNAMQAELVIKAQELFKEKEGGVLQAISELQKITLSPYLSQFLNVSHTPTELVENSPKIKYAVEAIKAVHKTNPNAGQIIYAEKGIDIFRPLREYFIDVLKYKPGQVAIIDSSVPSDVKDDIQDKFQNGEVKILIASGTVKEGVDLQRTSTDLYNLHLQWNPTDMIQAEGRTWRQGSFYDNVRIHYPLVENSVDPFIFQKLEEKSSRISDIFSYKGDSLDVSDINFEDMKFELITDPVLRVEAEETFARAEHDSKVRVAQAELAFMERKAGKVNEIKDNIKNYEEYKASARERDDAGDVNYYAEKIVKANKELGDEKQRLVKKGIDVKSLAEEISKKQEEVKSLKEESEKIIGKFDERLEKAKKEKVEIKTGETDYATLTKPFESKEFFTHDGEIALKLPPKMASLFEVSDTKVEKILSEKKTVKILTKVLEETNPFLRRQIMTRDLLKIVDEKIKLPGGLVAKGTYDTHTGEIELYRGWNLKRTAWEEIMHFAYSYLTTTEKQVAVDYLRKLSIDERRQKLGKDEKGNWIYDNYSEHYNKNEEAIAEEIAIHEALNDTGSSFARKLRAIYRAVVDFIYRMTGILDKMNSKLKARALFEPVFDNVPGFYEGRYQTRDHRRYTRASLDESVLRKSGEPKHTEKRRVYMEAFNKVFGENKPPSLGKMIEEEFKNKERRTLISAEKLEAIGMRTFKTAFSEGKEVGYLKGEAAAIMQTEKDIEEVKGKLDRSEYKNQEQRAMMEVKLDDLAQKHTEQKNELMAKMDLQSERFKRQKQKLREKLKMKMSDYRAVRKEMVVYIKDNLPRKSWSKFLIAVRDGKTPEALAKVVAKVDEEVVNLQRQGAIRNIQKIIKRADTLPIEFQMMIKNITEGINWKGVLPNTIKQLERINNYIKNHPEAAKSMPMRILRRLGILEKKSFKDLTAEELLAINARLERIKQVGKAVAYDKKVLRIIQRTKKLDRLMTESVNHDVFQQSGLTAEDREKITAWEKTKDKLQTADWQVMPIDSFMELIDAGNTNGSNYELIKRPVDVGFNDYWRTSKEIKNRLWDFINKMKETQNITEKEWERIGIHAIREQKGGRAKLKGSGYTDDQMDAVELTEPEMALYGYMREELDALFPMIKQIYESTYDKELLGVEGYFPFIMDWGNREPIYQEFEAEFNFGQKGTEKGFTTQRKGGFNPIKVNALEAFIDHIDKATYFIALESTIKEIRDLVKSHRYGEAVGEKAQSYVMKWVELIERHGTPKDPKDIAALDALRKNVTWGVLAFKLTTIPIQLTAVFNGTAEVGHYAPAGFVEYMTSSETADFILKASPQMEQRVGDDPVYKEVAPDRKLRTAREIGMWGIKKFDYATTAGVWIGAYRQFLDNHEIEFSYDDVVPEAAMYADKIVRKTQATADYKDLPPFLVQRARTIGKLLLQFQNFTLFQFAYIRGDIKRNVSTNKSKAAWQISMIIINSLAGMWIRDLIARGIYGEKDEDDEEGLVSKLTWEMAQNIPMIGNFAYGIRGLINYGSTTNMLSGIPTIDTGIKMGQSAGKSYTGVHPETKWKYAVKAAAGAATLRGVPGAQQLGQFIQGRIPDAPKGNSSNKYQRYGGSKPSRF